MIKNIPGISGLVTATVLNTKISEVENKIPGVSGLVTTNILNIKIWEKKLRIKFIIMITIFTDVTKY